MAILTTVLRVLDSADIASATNNVGGEFVAILSVKKELPVASVELS
jgi:hypothetical protein